jgi:hypothetical protein
MEQSEGDMSLKNPVTPPGIDPGTVRLVTQHLNHYATPGPIYLVLQMEKLKGNGPAGSSLGSTSTDSIVIALYPQEVY